MTSTRLTIYLSKEKDDSDAEIIRDIDVLTAHRIEVAEAESAVLYIRAAQPHPPSWAQFFSGYVDKKDIGNSSSPGGVLVVRLKDSTFLITFGLGRHLIVNSRIQRDFGLIVALNSIGASRLRSIDKASHERTPLNSRTQASKGVDIFELALNTEVDLLTAITGSSNVEKFGAQVTGRDALTLNLKSDLSSLCDVLLDTHTYYQKDD